MLGWRVIPRVGFGNFTVSPHGLGIALGYFVGTIVLTRRARARGFDEDHAWNAAALSVVGAIFGARLAYIVGHLSEFESPLEWLQIYKGGISLIGGLLGGFLAGYLYCRSKQLKFLVLSDLGAPGIAIGTAIGRMGDLIIGDHLGKETSGWWGWRYKGGELISPPRCIYDTVDTCIKQGMVVHQTALYDAIWSLAIFGILMMLDRKRHRTGFLTLVWAGLYASGRIATDFTRVDDTRFGLGLTGSQLTSIVVLAICIYFLFKGRGTDGEMLPATPAVAGPGKPGKAKAGGATASKPATEAARQTRTIVLDPEEKDSPAKQATTTSKVVKPKSAPDSQEESVFKAAREQREKAKQQAKPGTSPKATAAQPSTPSKPSTSSKPAAAKPGTSPKATAAQPSTSPKPTASKPATPSKPGTSPRPAAAKPKPKATSPEKPPKAAASEQEELKPAVEEAIKPQPGKTVVDRDLLEEEFDWEP